MSRAAARPPHWGDSAINLLQPRSTPPLQASRHANSWHGCGRRSRIRPDPAPEGLRRGPVTRMAWAMTRKVAPPFELLTLLEPKKDVLRGISEDCGLNSCPVPCGRGEQPLKTTLLQEASRPFRACQALEGQTTPASCRRAAIRRNLSQEPAAPEIRLSRSPAQRFSGASEGFGCTQPLTACTERISASSSDPLAP